MNDALQSFIQCLHRADSNLSARIGLGPGIEEIADMLWLAEQLPRVESKTEGEPDDESLDTDEVELTDELEDESIPDELPGAVQTGVSNKLTSRSNSLGTSTKPIRIPAAAALRQPLSLARSLRALIRKVESRTQEIIDEESTAIAIAEKNPVGIIKIPSKERWLDLELIVERSKASQLWEKTSKEFAELLERLGAFRTVRIWTLTNHLDDKEGYQPVLISGLRPIDSHNHRVGKPKELLDSSGQRMVMLLSDCISPLWREGVIHKYLADWGKYGPTVLVQWFPPEYWSRTGLKDGDEVWLSSMRPASSSNSLLRKYTGVNPDKWLDFDEEDASPTKSFVIPVVNLEPDVLKNWAQVVSGSGGTQIQGRRFELNWNGSAWQGPVRKAKPLPSSGVQKVGLFFETASEIAKELARLMSLGPVSPEITNLIQETLLPQSRVVHVAEVFLSGLLEVSDKGNYHFSEDIQQILQQSTIRIDKELVFQALSKYISVRYGQTPREFQAFIQQHSDWNKEQWNKIEGFAVLQKLQSFEVSPNIDTISSEEKQKDSAEDLDSSGKGPKVTTQDTNSETQNVDRGFIGSAIRGHGFIFEDKNPKSTSIKEMKNLMRTNPKNKERIFPYISGRDIAISAQPFYQRYVINFEQMTEQEARQWPELMSIIETKVKPERQALNSQYLSSRWWQFSRPRPQLYKAISTCERVLVTPRVRKHNVFLFLESNMVFAESLVVFPFETYAAFAGFQSSIHDVWVRLYSSRMGRTSQNYSLSDCFSNFPFPPNWKTSSQLEEIGEKYYTFREALMTKLKEGTTSIYNRFHNPNEDSSDFVNLRLLQKELDHAVVNAYGWQDIDLSYGFSPDHSIIGKKGRLSEINRYLADQKIFFVDSKEAAKFKLPQTVNDIYIPWCYGWPENTRNKIIERLLSLQKAEGGENTKRANKEVKEGYDRQKGLSRAVVAEDGLEKPSSATTIKSVFQNEDSLMVDRTDLLQNIFDSLNSHSSVALVGDPGVGKTALLRNVEYLSSEYLNSKRRPIYLNLAQIDDESDFYFALCSSVEIEECRGYKLVQALASKRILLLIDEMGQLTKKGFTAQLRSQLRGLSIGRNSPLQLVITARSPLHRLFIDDGVVSPLSNIFKEIVVPPLRDVHNINKSDAAAARNFTRFSGEKPLEILEIRQEIQYGKENNRKQKHKTRIESLRHSKNMTQVELANRLDVSISTIQNWEKKYSYAFFISSLLKITQVLQCSLRDLVTIRSPSRKEKRIPKKKTAKIQGLEALEVLLESGSNNVEGSKKEIEFEYRIADIRQKVGLTQEELAVLIEVSTQTVQNWESNRTPPRRLIRVLDLCEALDCELNDLLDERVDSSNEGSFHDARFQNNLKHVEPSERKSES